MLNRIPILLALVAATIVALMGLYGMFLYTAAIEADATQDAQNRRLVESAFEEHKVERRKVLEALAVSDQTFDALRAPDPGNQKQSLCLSLMAQSDFASLAVMSLSGRPLLLCEAGVAKPVAENDYVFAIPRTVFSTAFDGFLQQQRSYGAILPEFQFAEHYSSLAERHYLITAALSAPASKRVLPVDEEPLVILGYSSLNATLEETGTKLGISDLTVNRRDAATQAALLTIGGERQVGTMVLGWQPSQAFRNQLLRVALPVLFPALAVLFLIGYFLTRIDNLRIELSDGESRMRHMALHDSLTALPNRTHFHQLLAQAIAHFTPERACYVAIFDLDAFKIVNDTHGHDVGDVLLQQTALRASQAMGASNVVARLGGDEFGALLKTCDSDAEALRFFEQVGKKISHQVHIGALTLEPSSSIGVVRISGNTQSLEDVLKKADLALYDVKAHGKGHCRMFEG